MPTRGVAPRGAGTRSGLATALSSPSADGGAPPRCRPRGRGPPGRLPRRPAPAAAGQRRHVAVPHGLPRHPDLPAPWHLARLLPDQPGRALGPAVGGDRLDGAVARGPRDRDRPGRAVHRGLGHAGPHRRPPGPAPARTTPARGRRARAGLHGPGVELGPGGAGRVGLHLLGGAGAGRARPVHRCTDRAARGRPARVRALVHDDPAQRVRDPARVGRGPGRPGRRPRPADSSAQPSGRTPSSPPSWSSSRSTPTSTTCARTSPGARPWGTRGRPWPTGTRCRPTTRSRGR